jgi:hypothetical protein
MALGKGSRLLALDAQQRPAFYAALNGLGEGRWCRCRVAC